MLFLILSRALHFGSCLALLSIFAMRLVFKPYIVVEDGTGAWRIARICLVVAAVSGASWLWAAIAGMNGSSLLESLSPTLIQMVLLQTPPGQVWLVRFAIILLLALLLGCSPRPWTWLAAAALSVALAASLAWLGHAGAAEGPHRPLMLAADVAHLIAAGIWPAGLLPFALLLRRIMKTGALLVAHAAVRRFSLVSLLTVGVLAASGIANTCFLVGSIHALVVTIYGRLLLIKLALFATAIALGARNLLIHKPRLETAPQPLEAIARNIWIELIVASLIVLVVAILGTMPPASFPT